MEQCAVLTSTDLKCGEKKIDNETLQIKFLTAFENSNLKTLQKFCA